MDVPLENSRRVYEVAGEIDADPRALIRGMARGYTFRADYLRYEVPKRLRVSREMRPGKGARLLLIRLFPRQQRAGC